MTLNKAYFESQCRALKGFIKYNNNKRILVHMDGSDESFAAAAFCIQAVGVDNVIGLITPDVHTKHALAERHCDALEIMRYIIPVTLPVADILNQIRVAGIHVSDQTVLGTSSVISQEVLYLVANELGAHPINKFYLNDTEYHEFIRLYGVPELDEGLM